MPAPAATTSLRPEPSRSGEWRDGIGATLGQPRLQRSATPRTLLAPYLDAVARSIPAARLRIYPGSPLIAQHLLRPQDRLIACELEPQRGRCARAALRGDRRAKALAIDGWTALGAYVPPKERRGLVLVDPPFEDRGRFHASVGRARRRRTANGRPASIMLWYPIKDREAPDALARRLRRLGMAKILRSELMLGPPRADAGLVGSGLIVVNPPFTLEQDLRVLLPALGGILSPGQPSDRLAGAGNRLAQRRSVAAHFSTR